MGLFIQGRCGHGFIHSGSAPTLVQGGAGWCTLCIPSLKRGRGVDIDTRARARMNKSIFLECYIPSFCTRNPNRAKLLDFLVPRAVPFWCKSLPGFSLVQFDLRAARLVRLAHQQIVEQYQWLWCNGVQVRKCGAPIRYPSRVVG